jgi:flagellar hook-basal body complex protein FliE
VIDKIGAYPTAGLTGPTAPISPGTSTKSATGAVEVGKEFGDFLTDALNSLHTQQQKVDELNKAYLKGELSSVDQLTIAAEQAMVALELTVQVRNKAVEAYQEIMRMQI